MTTFKSRFARAALILLAPLIVAGCGINTIPTKEEAAKAQWAEVQNQYQRRADLIPNLVATVKGYAAQEKSVLVEVTEARASATQVKVDASTITDPAAFQQYQQAQDKLSGVLGRLMMIQETLSGPEVEPELPGPAEPARGHREPHRHRPARLQRGGPRLQHHAADLPAGVLGQDHATRRSKPMQLFSATRVGPDRADGQLRHHAAAAARRRRPPAARRPAPAPAPK